MALEAQSPAVFEFIELAARACVSLLRSSLADPKTGLGGKLFYMGDLDAEGRALVVAANVAGAASLVATADPAAQKQAVRDGVADFLVNSLDEALRILKNQLRKRETVAVCVSLAPEAVEREIEERGVLPDLLRRDLRIAPYEDAWLHNGERIEGDPSKVPAIVTWQVRSASARWLPRLDAIALDCLDAAPLPDAWIARRWLRLSPRFLGRMAQGLRLLHCDRGFAAYFVERVRLESVAGAIGTSVEIRSRYANAHVDLCYLEPDHPDSAN